MDSNELNQLISKNVPWSKLADHVKQVNHRSYIIIASILQSIVSQSVGNSEEYDKKVFEFNVKNQMRYRKSLGLSYFPLLLT